jgi:hypothetical protein
MGLRSCLPCMRPAVCLQELSLGVTGSLAAAMELVPPAHHARLMAYVLPEPAPAAAAAEPPPSPTSAAGTNEAVQLVTTPPGQRHQQQQRQQEEAFRILPASLAPWGTLPDAACCRARLAAYLQWDGTCGRGVRAAAHLPSQLYLVLQQLLSQFAYCCPDSDELVVRSSAVPPFKENLLGYTHERIHKEVGPPRDFSSSREDTQADWTRRNDIVGLLLLNAALRQVSRAGAGVGCVSLLR